MAISQYFPSWYLGTFPEHRVILASYEASFAATWGRKARDAMEQFGEEVFGLRVRQDSSAANRWDLTDHEGGMVTAGTGGPITGKGANLLIIDDPVKNEIEAGSATYRERAWDWWLSTALTRMEPNGVIAFMMTRWHEDDLGGRVLKQAAELKQPWTLLSLPALAEKDESYRDDEGVIFERKEGEAIWPDRYPVEVLLRAKVRGSYWWAAQYQQRPAPAEGSLFKRSWFKYFEQEQDGEEVYYILHVDKDMTRRVRAKDCWVFQTCDPAASEKEMADWFVLATWAVTPTMDLLLIDVLREHAETVNHEEILRQALIRYQPVFQGVENKAFGLNIIQNARIKGMPVKPLAAEQDKVARARTVSARYEIGAVFHRANAPWLGEWEDELIWFPKGEHDDQVDVAAYAGIEIVRHGAEVGTVEVEILGSGDERSGEGRRRPEPEDGDDDLRRRGRRRSRRSR